MQLFGIIWIVYIYIHTHTHIYIYIYIERERECVCECVSTCSWLGVDLYVNESVHD